MKTAPSPDFEGRDITYGECRLSGEYCFIMGRAERICHNGTEADIIFRTTGIEFNKKRTRAKLAALMQISKECRNHPRPADFLRQGQWTLRKKDGAWTPGMGQWSRIFDMRFRCRE